MGELYLTDLADVLRRAGLEVVELDGWQTRARGSGGYEPGRPTHVMVHHTASPPSWSGQRDADYCAHQDEDAPLSNFCLDRDGCWWVLAAGATNTNGKGSDTWGGGVPDDSMNSYAIGVEANGGYGEAWPAVQQEAYLAGVAALCARYGISPAHVRGHVEWAPDRKVDPAGPSRWSPDTGTWDLDAFRRDVTASGGGGTESGGETPEPAPEPTPTPDEEEDEMTWRVGKLENGPFYIGDGKTSYTVGDSGHQVSMDEAACRMAPGAINVIRCIWDGANDSNAGPRMVTSWNQVKATMPAKNVRKYVGDNANL